MADFYLMVPHDIKSKDDYDRGWKIAEVFPVNGTGVVTGRDSMTIDIDKNHLWDRIEDFAKSSEDTVRRTRKSGQGRAKLSYGGGVRERDRRSWIGDQG
jgi:hypothetical protein